MLQTLRIRRRSAKAIANLCRTRRVLIIAHRLDVVKMCDKVAVVEDKTIRALGTHEEITCNKRKYYKMHGIHIRGTKVRCKSIIQSHLK